MNIKMRRCFIMNIISLLLLISYLITIYLYFYLMHKRKEINKKRNRQPIKISNFELRDFQGRSRNLFQDDENIKILIFVNELCIHCDNHLETFLNEVFESRLSIKPVVVMNVKFENYATELSAKYGKEIDLLFCNENILRLFNITFYPSFVIINHKYILSKTPAPIEALDLLRNLMQKKKEIYY